MVNKSNEKRKKKEFELNGPMIPVVENSFKFMKKKLLR